MQKLTAIKAKALIYDLGGLRTIREELFRQALEIALPVLEQQERGNDRWIEWKGGECPTYSLVEFEMRDGDKHTSLGDMLDWKHESRSDDIIAYRVVEQERERGEEE
ncbi:MAG: hypothetical protein E6868_08330 [Pantoea sp.]|uniref:hypothetical protein n=1 Tax=Pantoea sp. TaxID=69393 RepID=UPI0028FE1327|nr:hypothetical protein [Pantoea sp.]MDU1573243.1 hypothetical protein [Pantoea sp.]